MNRTLTENRGTFTIVDGNVSKGTTPILTWFNDTTVLVPMNARSSFSLPAEHQMFDQMLIDLSKNLIAIQYIDSIRGFMNPSERFKEFINGTLDPASVGIVLTPEQAAMPRLYAEVTDMFKATFTPPKSAGALLGGIDLNKHFTSAMVEVIEGWREGKMNITSGIRQLIEQNQLERNLLRLVKTSSAAYRVESATGHSITRTMFMTAWKEAKRFWASSREDFITVQDIEAKERGASYAHARSTRIYPTHVQIGCQAIPRAEVEAIGARLDELFPSK